MPRLQTKSEVAIKPVLVWHSAAHERFKEQLYYLLMSVKPFDDARLKSEIQKLLARYGVSKFCAYQLFGNFDLLLRVWLPPQVFREFSEDVRGGDRIQNLVNHLHFQTLRKLQCSGFYGFGKNNTAELANALQELSPDRVLKVQRERDAQELEQWEQKRVLRIRTAEEQEDEGKHVKAFIAFSEPLAGLPDHARGKILNGLADKLNEGGRGFESITLLEGTGFCWLFAKLVVTHFPELGRFVHDVAEEFGPLGVSTSTFLVTRQEDAIEGDSISEEALREFEPGNRRVAAFIPDLYRPGAISADKLDKRGIEDFVLEEVLPATEKHDETQLERYDLDALKGFLEGVIAGDRDAAFVALFPRIISAESALRRPVENLAKRCQGNVQALIDELRKHDPKADRKVDLTELTLLDSLRAARWILGQLLPNDPWAQANLKDAVLQGISKHRNTVAHGKEFQPRSDWQALGRAMLQLFLLRNGITSRYELLSEQANEVKPQTNT